MMMWAKIKIVSGIVLAAVVAGRGGIVAAQGGEAKTGTSAEGEFGKSGQEGLPPSYKFDFGSTDSETFPGFTQVAGEDSYNPAKGYGWQGSRRSYARIGFKIINPDPLCYDSVHAEDATFELNLPNDDYEVVLLCGDIGTYKGFYHPKKETLGVRTGYSVAAQGVAVVKVAALDEESFQQWLFKYADDDWQPGYNVWDKYIAPRYRLHRLPVRIKDGRLTLAFRDCPVSMLAVYPAEYKTKIDREIRQLDKDRRALFPYREIKYPDQAPFPVLTEKEKEKGYLVFVKHYLHEVFPEMVPKNWTV